MITKIPFSPPFINEDVEQEVLSALHSGWITTGPKVRQLEEAFNLKYGFKESIGVNSWTSGAILVLRWLGIKEGDEVIIPAYTYSATALAVLHAGGTPVMVDVEDDFNISVEKIEKAITSKTKAIIGVDIGGFPADYDGQWDILSKKSVQDLFVAESEVQQKLGRCLLIADSAHSFGSDFGSKLADIVVFSLHAVKNLTSAEGGIISLNLPESFDVRTTYTLFRRLTLNGQSKDALDKSRSGSWRYDIVEFGMKCNLPDVNAAIALGQLKSWDSIQSRRISIFQYYSNYFKKFDWAILPPETKGGSNTSGHLFMLRIAGIKEELRDEIISEISKTEVTVNVHFIPMPMLTLFKNLGYDIQNYPKAYSLYENEISLPIYPSLTDEKLHIICTEVSKAIENAKTSL